MKKIWIFVIYCYAITISTFNELTKTEQFIGCLLKQA